MSKVTLQNASTVINSEVKLVNSRWPDAANNPLWGGTQGQVKGKLVKHHGHCIEVLWDNGHKNYYDDNCLEVIVATPAPVVTIGLAPAPAVTPVSLERAVQEIIDSKVKNGDQFSAYDITSALRNLVNSGLVVLENRPVEDVNGRQTQRVTHNDVRPVVRSYMQSQATYTAAYNQDYIVYQQNGVPSVPAVASAPVSAPRSVVITPTGTSVTGGASSSNDRATLLVAYITNNGSRTLKQIQSRFKVRGQPQPTCKELAGVAEGAGLKVAVNHSTYHRSVVSV